MQHLVIICAIRMRLGIEGVQILKEFNFELISNTCIPNLSISLKNKLVQHNLFWSGLQPLAPNQTTGKNFQLSGKKEKKVLHHLFVYILKTDTTINLLRFRLVRLPGLLLVSNLKTIGRFLKFLQPFVHSNQCQQTSLSNRWPFSLFNVLPVDQTNLRYGTEQYGTSIMSCDHNRHHKLQKSHDSKSTTSTTSNTTADFRR